MRKSNVYLFMMILLMGEITCWSQTMITTKIGQNAWYVDPNNNTATPPNFLDNFYPDIFQSGAQYIRIGGARVNFKQLFDIDASQNVFQATNLIYLIDKIVANGMEPIVQVSFEPQTLCTAPVGQQEGNLLGTLSQADQAKVAGSLVGFLKTHYTNNPPPGNPTFKVKYYIISNEPDNSVDCSNGGGFGFNGGGASPTQALIDAHASAISSYIQDFAEEMKNADPTIKIIAPGLTYFSTDDNDPNARMYSQLISSSHPSSVMGNISTTGAGNGLPFVDIVSFHMYPNLSSRSAVITNLNSTTSSFKAKCSVTGITGKTGLVQRIEGAGRTAGNCKIACTEFNLEDAGLNLDESNAADYKTIIEGSSNRSYIGGQWMAATLCQAFLPVNATNQQWVEFMTPWSVKEGVCKPINSDDRTFGYIGCTAGGNKKRPSYWLYQMVAKNFNGNLLSTSLATGNYQTFAYKNANEIGVLIMNQDQTGPGSYGKTFRVNLDGSTPSTTGINVNVAAGLGVNDWHQCYIKSESTVLLKFNLAGVLQSRTEYNIEDARNDVGPKTWNPTSNDAYIADHPGDVGNQPNQEIATQNGGISWASTDIWVRNSDESETVTGNNRYLNEHDHQNPQWTGTPGNEPYVFVKVRNRGCSPITGNVLAYWDNASTGLTWNAMAANLVDPTNTAGPALALNPGEERVVKIQWKAMTSLPIPNPGLGNTANYCFVARWVSSSEPADGEDISNGAYSLGNNVFNFNNFAQKNVTIVGGAQKHPVFVGNPTGTSILTNLAFDTPVNEINHPFTDEGYINIDLGQTLYAKWIAGGKQGTGIIDGVEKHKHTLSDGSFHYHLDAIANNNPYEIKIVASAASIGNLSFSANELLSVALKFNFTPTDTLTNEYTWDIIQKNLDDFGSFSTVGGERYLIRPPACTPVNAGADVTLYALCETDLNASGSSARDALYTWYNLNTGLVEGTGSSIHVNPLETTIYEVELITGEGCISYDWVTVIRDNLGSKPCVPGVGRLANSVGKSDDLKEGISFNAFPNPFTDNLTVTYSLPQDSKAGSLKIMEAASGKLVYISGLSSAKNKLDIKLNVAAGLYICHIIADDGTSKQFKLVHIK